MSYMAKIDIEVAYALPNRQKVIALQVDEGATLESAIVDSGMLDMFPEIDLSQTKVGVFSKSRQLVDVVKAGERIEIYRPLAVDPKEARRRRVGRE